MNFKLLRRYIAGVLGASIIAGCAGTSGGGSLPPQLSAAGGSPPSKTSAAHTVTETFPALASIPASAATQQATGIVKWIITPIPSNHEISYVGLTAYNGVAWYASVASDPSSGFLQIVTSTGENVKRPTWNAPVVPVAKGNPTRDQAFEGDLQTDLEIANGLGGANPPGGGGGPIAAAATQGSQMLTASIYIVGAIIGVAIAAALLPAVVTGAALAAFAGAVAGALVVIGANTIKLYEALTPAEQTLFWTVVNTDTSNLFDDGPPGLVTDMSCVDGTTTLPSGQTVPSLNCTLHIYVY